MTLRSHLFIYFNTWLRPAGRVTHQNDRNCLRNIIKFVMPEVILMSAIANLSNIPISPWARIGHHAPPPSPH